MKDYVSKLSYEILFGEPLIETVEEIKLSKKAVKELIAICRIPTSPDKYRDFCRKLTEWITRYYHFKKVKVRVLNGREPNAFAYFDVVEGYFAKSFNEMEVFFGFTRGLLKLLTERELAAVVLHEIGHVNRLKKAFYEYVLKSIGGVIAGAAVVSGIIANAALPLIIALFITFQASLGTSLVSRLNEKDADKYAIEHGLGVDLSSALSKIAEYYYHKPVNEIHHGLWERIRNFLSGSHPLTKDRVCEIIKLSLPSYPERTQAKIKRMYSFCFGNEQDQNK